MNYIIQLSIEDKLENEARGSECFLSGVHTLYVTSLSRTCTYVHFRILFLLLVWGNRNLVSLCILYENSFNIDMFSGVDGYKCNMSFGLECSLIR